MAGAAATSGSEAPGERNAKINRRVVAPRFFDLSGLHEPGSVSMNTFDKLCGAVAFPVGVIFVVPGVIGRVAGRSFENTVRERAG